MGSLDKRIEALEKLYKASSFPSAQAGHYREAIITKLTRMEEARRTRLAGMTPEERAEFYSNPEQVAEREALEEEIRRRRGT